jgi:hypothetical protein
MKTRIFGRFTGALAALGLFAAAMVNAADDTPARRFAWLSGHWCSESGDQLLEEVWLSSRGSAALGVGRTVKAGKTTFFEFMRIETRDGVTNFIAVLEGQEPVPFKLVASGADWARFENPQHDFPTRVEYRRTPAGLHAEIAGPGENGKQTVMPFDFGRCAD